MSDGRSPFTERLMGAIRADERDLAVRRSSVMRGFAASVVVLGLLLLARQGSEPGAPPASPSAGTDSNPAALLAALEGGGEDARAALHELAVRYVEDGDEAAREACLTYVQERARKGDIDLFHVFLHAATKDKAKALSRARRLATSRSVRVAASNEDWDALLADLSQVTDEEDIWAVLYYLESFGPADAAPYLPWATAQLGHASDEIRVRALQTARKLAPAGIENQLVALLQTGTVRERQVAILVAKSLGLATETTPAILGVLGDADPTVRVNAVETLAHFGDASNLTAVSALVGDGEIQVRLSAAYAAAVFGDPQHLDSVADVANGTIPAGTVNTIVGFPESHAMRLLADLGDGRAADAAEAHLADFVAGTTDKRLVVSSLLILERMHRVSAIPLVESLETAGNTNLWIHAGATLHSLGSPQGAVVLNTYFHSSNEMWRTLAINAAARLEDEVFRDDFEDLQSHESETTRDSADRAIDRLDESAGGN